jgi:hypothetical protein
VLRQPETPGSFPKKLEIVCRMEGYLEERVSVGPERVERLVRDGDLEAVLPTEEQKAMAAMSAGAQLLGQVLAGVPIPGVGLAGIALGLLGLAGTVSQGQGALAYRSLPVLLLIPERFASEDARDEFVAALQWQIEAAGAQRRARIDENCFPFPCDPLEGPCPHPSCVEQRSRVDDDVNARVDALRSRLADTRVVSP